MKENIFSGAAGKGIFRDEKVLYPEFVPERLPFRDRQIDLLVHALKPSTEGRKPQNVFVSGLPGTGKTVTVKFVLNELEAFSDRAKALYLNCWQCNSRNAILAELNNFLGSVVPRRGVATDELYSRFVQSMKQSKFIPLLVLDEVDQLIKAEDGSKVLYDLLRVSEMQKNFIGLILVSNDASLIAELDARVRSSLASEQVDFSQYSPNELKEILKVRCQYAFQDNVLEPEVINVAAGHAAKLGGDARIAIESLLKAGRLAENENSGVVSLAQLRQAFSIADEAILKKGLQALNEDEKKLLKLIAAGKGIESGKLYRKFLGLEPKSKSPRSYRVFTANLEKLGLIECRQIELSSGRSRFISLKIPEAFLEGL
ncbi:AAA family ATPase [archaeon]|nr:AAA family ATPase [archaeon]